MAGTCMIALEGVLANHTDAPINEGLVLYQLLAQQYRLVVVTEWTQEQAERWLQQHRLNTHALVLCRPDDDTVGTALRVWQLERLRASGDHIALLVDSNPGAAAAGLHHGINTLLFAHPKYMRPDHRPDSPKGARPWEELVGEITTQQRLHDEDTRRQAN